MVYTHEGWVNPGRPGLPQARCSNPGCTQDGVPGLLCVAMTLDEQGRCAACCRDADESHRTLRLDGTVG